MLLASFAMNRVDCFTDECNFFYWATGDLRDRCGLCRQADLGWRPPEFVSAQPRTDEVVILILNFLVS